MLKGFIVALLLLTASAALADGGKPNPYFHSNQIGLSAGVKQSWTAQSLDGFHGHSPTTVGYVRGDYVLLKQPTGANKVVLTCEVGRTLITNGGTAWPATIGAAWSFSTPH